MRQPPELVVVGTSLGGLNALLEFVRGLPATLSVPIVLVQHRGATAETTLVEMLSQGTALTVVEAEDKVEMKPGTIYLAPPDYHLLVEADGTLALSTDAPVRSARPSIDVLFETAADAYGDRLIAVLLTGASADGAAGLSHVKRRGGCAIVQDPATAECATMPSAGIAATRVDYILPLRQIGEHVMALVEGTRV
jgi:two-component system, chemotaxis family, protein-glutamate methylesterase/glutaminase